jgi:methylated-DNA-[protein]-cysteine S-methyltransferase
VLDDIAAQLGEYFEGRRRSFDVALVMEGSSFQRLVWSQLRQIPFATTVSYGQLAAQLGRPGSARAVGHANARNPIAIIVPCHRVIGSSGDLTGYGGGLEAKRHLLDLEVGHGVAHLEVGHGVAHLEVGHGVDAERPRPHRRGSSGTVAAHRASLWPA